MKLFKRAISKVYYFTLKIILKNREVSIPQEFKNTRNLFIYFDYEREFSGHKVNITDNNIFSLLEMLSQNNITATWFTVGKIFEKYPVTILEILSRNHEIGSHTYSHIKLLNASNTDIENDFRDFYSVSSEFCKVIGLHSPNNKWSLPIFKEMRRYGFKYDVVYKKNEIGRKVLSFNLSKDIKTLRFFTVGDDWPLFNNTTNSDYVFSYLVDLYRKAETGNIYGIGFHPWIIFSNKEIYNGFNKFLGFLKSEKNIIVRPVNYFASRVLEYNETS